ncbi:MAG: glycosyltransferase [Candidatus Zixiibacteriota bacterium]|nr:MAG: glycosyltransferase [candidate division Zixibacteria bacterium]
MNRNGLRLLVLADSRSFHTERYVRQLRRQGCRVLLASLERGSTLHFHLRRVGPLKTLHYALSRFQVKQLVSRFEPDIVNPHFVSGYGSVVSWPWLRLRVPIFTHLWGSDILVVPEKSRLHHWKTARGLKAANFVCADSEYLLSKARRVADFRAPSAVVPWGIEREFLALHKPEYQIRKPLKMIVARSHEAVYRNVMIVRALFEQIRAQSVELTFPGFGSEYHQFRTETSTMVGDSLRFYDRMPRNAFMKFMAEHDVYLSNSALDSSPASMIEAMALGLIPVAASHPGLTEWLDSSSGFVYDADSENALSKIVGELSESQNTFEDMRRRNLERVRQNAVFEDNVARIIELMSGLTG